MVLENATVIQEEKMEMIEKFRELLKLEPDAVVPESVNFILADIERTNENLEKSYSDEDLKRSVELALIEKQYSEAIVEMEQALLKSDRLYLEMKARTDEMYKSFSNETRGLLQTMSALTNDLYNELSPELRNKLETWALREKR